jgi:hypothetical protein
MLPPVNGARSPLLFHQGPGRKKPLEMATRHVRVLNLKKKPSPESTGRGRMENLEWPARPGNGKGDSSASVLPVSLVTSWSRP